MSYGREGGSPAREGHGLAGATGSGEGFPGVRALADSCKLVRARNGSEPSLCPFFLPLPLRNSRRKPPASYTDRRQGSALCFGSLEQKWSVLWAKQQRGSPDSNRGSRFWRPGEWAANSLPL